MIISGDGLFDHIESEFQNSPIKFPRAGTLNYPSAMRGWIAGLDANLLPYVTVGGVAIDGGHLTLHDREHVEKVKHVAAALVRGLACDISPYEMTLLLYSVYMHDIGNILGRAGHEAKIASVLSTIGAPPGLDSVETRAARMIARVHGGRIDDSKDTISTLSEENFVYGQRVRIRLLAALLRLADELAEDPARANKIQLAAGVLVKSAEVYHQFAANIHSQIAEPATRTIHIRMEFSDPNLFQRKLGKGDKEVDMLDEIFERAMKTYLEARYCSRFLRPHLDFEKVSVEINIYDGDGPLVEEIKFNLAETGYGDETRDIYMLSPELDHYRGNGRLTPALLRRRIDDAMKPMLQNGEARA